MDTRGSVPLNGRQTPVLLSIRSQDGNGGSIRHYRNCVKNHVLQSGVGLQSDMHASGIGQNRRSDGQAPPGIEAWLSAGLGSRQAQRETSDETSGVVL